MSNCGVLESWRWDARVWATLEELWKWGVMSRWRGHDDGDGGEERISLERGWMSSESISMPGQPLHTSVCSSHGGGIAIADATGCVLSPLPSTQKHLSPHTGHMPPNTSPLSSPSPRLAFMSFSLSVPVLLSLMECQGLADAAAARLHGHAVCCCNPPLQHTHWCPQRRDRFAVMK